MTERFLKRVENTIGNGKIARYEKLLVKGEIGRIEQFLLFPQCFYKTCAGDM